jgi:23S rRNA (pseudouridine1915-N3)-methyltransferase
MKIEFVTVGKLKKDFHKTAFEYYLKRANKYFKINLVEKNKRSSKKARDRIENIGKRGSERTFSIVLDESGEEYTTSMLVKLIETLQVRGHHSVSFYIGGPFGLDNDLKNSADK